MRLYVVYALVTLYALCYQFQSPIEPFLVSKLLNNTEATAGANNADLATTYARMKSIFAVTQGVGSLAFGSILDKYGVRVGLIINFMACASCYYTLSITNSIAMLYLSKLPGIAMTGFLCAETAVFKLTKEGEERVKALGRLYTSYTIGGVLGPFIGGHLGASGDYYVGARYATYGSLIAVILVWLFIPASIDSKKVEDGDGIEKKKDLAHRTKWIDNVFLIFKLVWMFIFVKTVTSIANSMINSQQPLILKRLGAGEAMMGTVMSLQFGFGGFANAFLLAPVTRIMGGSTSLVVSNCIVAMALVHVFRGFLYSDAHDVLKIWFPENELARVYPFIGISMFLAIFQFTLASSISATTSAIVNKTIQGTLVGIQHCLFAFAYMAGPQLGALIYSIGDITGLSFICAATFCLVLFVFTKNYKEESITEVTKKVKDKAKLEDTKVKNI